MKKVFLMAVAALALTFTACTEGAQKNDEADAVVENLKAELEAGDANSVQQTLEGVQAKVAELVAKDPEAAKTYVVNTLVNTPAEAVINTLTAGQNIIDNAQQNAENVKDSLQSNIEQAVEDKVNETEQAINEKVDEAKQKANEKINDAADKATEKINDAANELLKGAGLNGIK